MDLTIKEKVKLIFDLRNELMPIGKTNQRNHSGHTNHNTVKEISKKIGWSTGKIMHLVRIHKEDQSLFEKICNEEITVGRAIKILNNKSKIFGCTNAVYFLSCEDKIKVGATGDFYSRLKSYRSAYPYIRLFGYIKAESKEEAFSIERYYHRRMFPTSKLKTEWTSGDFLHFFSYPDIPVYLTMVDKELIELI